MKQKLKQTPGQMFTCDKCQKKAHIHSETATQPSGWSTLLGFPMPSRVPLHACSQDCAFYLKKEYAN